MIAPAAVERLVRNELDPAYRRRVRTVLGWLDPAPGELVLDAGCGRGFFLAYLREVCDAAVVGCELRLDHLAVATRALAGRDRVMLLQANLEALPLAAASADHAILSEVLEHVADDVGVLRRVAAVVRPGGLVAITVPSARFPFWWDPVNWLLERIAARPIRSGPLAGIWAGHLRLYRPAELRRAVEAAGLEVVELHGATGRCPPFAHNLLYGLGKPVFESGLLPPAVRRAGDRHRVDGGRGGVLNPVRWALALVDLLDRGNPPAADPDAPAVNLCLLARRPPDGAARQASAPASAPSSATR